MKQNLILCIFGMLIGGNALAKVNGKIVLGMSQIGAESAWRVANSRSIQEAAKEADIVLDFSDAQQKQANQLNAVKTFILKKVDVIAIAPVVTSGWRDVLVRAKKAGIPVIILDREIDEKDTNLYSSFIGADFQEEGRRAARCLIDELGATRLAKPLKIVELRGTEGSAPAILRKKGFAEVMAPYPNAQIVRSENGDFKESLGKEWMEKILSDAQKTGSPIDAIFAHNDSMALGAISALESAGRRPGKEVKIVSVDAIHDAFIAMKSGKLNCTVECSPLLGPQLMRAVKDLVEKRPLPRRIITEEGVFPARTADQELPKRKY